jgi:hypothetical protein
MFKASYELVEVMWLRMKSKFSQNPEVSTALDMTTRHTFVTQYPIGLKIRNTIRQNVVFYARILS